MIMMNCNDAGLVSILSITKGMLNIIWIIGPILAIISLLINITMMLKDPDDKKIPKKIFNSLIALVVLFLIPAIINATMYMIGENSKISSCWNNASGRVTFNATYIDPYSGKRKTRFVTDPEYEKGDAKKTDDGTDISGTPDSSCGSLEYCNKFLTSMVNNSKRLNEAILKNNASVVYSNSGDPRSWAEAIKVAEAGRTVKISCNRPSHWGMKDVTGEYRDFWSLSAGGFKNYGGPMTKYTKQLKFNGSKSVKQGIKEGIVQPGDIIGTSGHTFAIYSVDKSSGSAVVFDGGHKFTNKCQQKRKCSPMFTYSASTNGGYKLYQIIRWVK